MMTSRSKTPKKSKTNKPKRKPIPKNIRDRCLTSFQKLRRIEEANDSGHVTCISCGKLMDWREAQGGHYISRSNRATELEHDNVWPQCPQCNGYLHGNVINYRIRLVRRIGEDRVKRIEYMAASYKGDDESTEELTDKDKVMTIRKKNKQWYLEKKREYDERIRQLIDEKGL